MPGEATKLSAVEAQMLRALRTMTAKQRRAILLLLKANAKNGHKK